jgi:hypothetical protein
MKIRETVEHARESAARRMTPHTLHYSVPDNRIDLVPDEGEKISLWWATKNEWLSLIDVAGLELEAVFGGFDGEPLEDESREYVFIVRR